ncbi:MAG: galactitol-1-phosphate 5-dehydrogenase, partial [Lachnospiraceae bacterium]|nr:galactitol-1-phosphate 5-dehydrogenase [Lachnospiraceae bacterium]
MKAWVLHDVGDIRYENIKTPNTPSKEVCVLVKAAGICSSDIPRIYETGAHCMPLILGHEFSGVVERIGSDVSPDWLGKRVAVCPKIPCGKCRECRNGFPERCDNYGYIGSRRDGAFAEYVNVPVDNLFPLPEHVSFEVGAMLEPMAVAANAMRTSIGRVKSMIPKDKPIAVCGLGTIGIMLVMLLKKAGYEKVYVIGRRESQKLRVLEMGISEDNYCDSCRENVPEWLRKKTDGGVFAFYECVGKNECVIYGIEGTTYGGSVVLVGNPYSDMSFSKDIYWKILRKQLHICGIWNSNFKHSISAESEDDWNYVLQRIVDGRVKPEKLITHRFAID